MYRVQCPSECLVENITDPSAATQFGGFNVSRRTFYGRAIRRREFGYDLQKGFAFIGNVLAIRTEQRMVLRHHQVDSGLKYSRI